MKKVTKNQKAKTTAKKPTKKSATVNHLQPVEGLLASIKAAEVKLQTLLSAIPKKLEILATKAKIKLSKAVEQHKKAEVKHQKLEAKHNAKPSKLTKAAVKKAEQALAGAASVVAANKKEHDEMQSQMTTCKEMKKAMKAMEKPAVKKAETKPTKKVSAKKQNTTGTEQSNVHE